MTRNILYSWYAATVLFLILDYFFGLSIRLAFLDPFPGLKIGYYLFCFACLAVMIWRPALTTLIGTVESLITLVGLILTMALRVMIITEPMIESGQGFVTLPELINFMLAGGITYIAWFQGTQELKRQLRRGE